MSAIKKHFIIKILVKVMFLVGIVWSIEILNNSPINTLIQNQIALGQMNNSDFEFILMQSYRQILSLAKIVISFIFGIFIIKDIYNFIKNKE